MKIPESLKLLNNFESDEISEFRKFLESPFFNKNKPILIVYNCIVEKQNYLAVNGYDEIINHILKKTNYTRNTTGKILSLLNERILTYYSVKNTLSDSVFTSIKLNQYLLKKSEVHQLNKNLKNVEGILKNKKLNFDDFFNSYIHKKNLIYSSVTGVDYWKRKNMINIFDKLNSSMLDLYFYFLMELVSAEMNKIFQRINTGISELPDLPVDLHKYFELTGEYISSDNIGKDKFILFNLYKKIFSLLNDIENNEKYLDYKNYLLTNTGAFDNDFVSTHINYILNYCTVRERLGSDLEFYMREGLEMLTYYIDNDCFKNTSSPYLHPELYHNYIISCMRLTETERLRIFLEKNTIKLNPDYAEEMMKYAMAHLFYCQKDYLNATKCISGIKINYFLFKYDIMSLEMKIYYYSNINKIFRTEIIEKITHNFLEKLNGDKFLTRNDKRALKKFVQHYKKYLLFFEKFRLNDIFIKSIISLKEEIEKDIPFVNKKWLGDEIDLVIAQHNVKMQSV